MRFATWLPLPLRNSNNDLWWDSTADQSRLVVLDTVDEMVLPQPTGADEPYDRYGKIALLRDLRAIARGRGLAVLLTARLASRAAGESISDAVWRHPWYEALADVADVQLEVERQRQHGRIFVDDRLGFAERRRRVLNFEASTSGWNRLRTGPKPPG